MALQLRVPAACSRAGPALPSPTGPQLPVLVLGTRQRLGVMRPQERRVLSEGAAWQPGPGAGGRGLGSRAADKRATFWEQRPAQGRSATWTDGESASSGRRPVRGVAESGAARGPASLEPGFRAKQQLHARWAGRPSAGWSSSERGRRDRRREELGSGPSSLRPPGALACFFSGIYLNLRLDVPGTLPTSDFHVF